MPARNEMPYFRIHLETTGNNRHPATRRVKAGARPVPPRQSRTARDGTRGESRRLRNALGRVPGTLTRFEAGHPCPLHPQLRRTGPARRPTPVPGLGPALRDPGRCHSRAPAEAAALAGRGAEGTGRQRAGGRHGPGGEGGTRR